MPDFVFNTLVAFTLVCTALNICWWLYGKTLSEVFPAVVVVVIMLTTLFCFLVVSKLLFEEACNNIFSSSWGYIADYNFISYSEDIARILAGILTIGTAILLYKDEGRINKSKYNSTDGEKERSSKMQSSGRQDSGKEGSGGTRRDLGKI